MPWDSTSTAPRQKNCVPMVATSEGIPNFTMMKPLSQPIAVPVSKAAQKARKTCRGMLARPDVALDGEQERHHAHRHDRREG